MQARRDVRLTPLQREHATAMSRWMLDPAVTDGLGIRTPKVSLETTLAWIDRAEADPSVRVFAVLQAGQHVGNIVLDRLDTYLETARLSVYVGEPDARGVGVGGTAVMLAARLAFEELNLHKLWLTVHAENIPAITAYLRVGFALEGVLRDEFLLAGRRMAALYMGLLRRDFRWLDGEREMP